jgi:hypothetical protein
MRKLALLIFVFACYVIVNDPAHLYTNAPAEITFTAPTSTPPVTTEDETSGHDIVSPTATLDSSQIDYEDGCWIEEDGEPMYGSLSKMPPNSHTVDCADIPGWQTDDTPVILPTDNNVVTPTILLNGVYVPEESPDGGYPIGWADNSPVYSDGWMLQVNDSTSPPITRWIAPEGH